MAASDDPDDHHTMALADVNLATVALESGEVAEARRRLEDAMAVITPGGDRWAVAAVQRDMARVAATEGNPAEARGLAMAALEVFSEWRDHSSAAETMEILAGMAAADGEMVRAARLAGAAGAVRAAVGGSMPALDRARLVRGTAPALDALGPEAFASAEAEGATMTFDQAVEHAIAWAGQKGRVAAGPASSSSSSSPAS